MLTRLGCIALFLSLVGCDSGGEPPAGTGGTSSEGCPAGEKACAGQCVAIDDPSWGCSPSECSAACSAKDAVVQCSSGACVIAECDEVGFADCDGDTSNGCEAELATNPAHCGACGNTCSAKPGQEATCVAGDCIVVCQFGRADCDGNPENGCEVELYGNDQGNCGSCGRDCGTTSCSDGVCEPEVVVQGVIGIGALTGNATHLLFSYEGASRAAKSLGASAENLFTGIVTTLALNAAGTTLYAADFATKKIVSTPVGALNTSPTSLADMGDAIGSRLRVGQNYVYYSDLNSIRRLPIAGGPAQVVSAASQTFDVYGDDLILAGGTPQAGFAVTQYAPDGNSTPLFPLGGTPHFVSVTAGSLAAFVEFSGSAVAELVVAPLTGPPVRFGSLGDTTFYTDNNVPQVDSDDAYIYYGKTRKVPGASVSNVYRISRTAPSDPELIMAGFGTGAAVHVDATHVYAADVDGGRILRVPK